MTNSFLNRVNTSNYFEFIESYLYPSSYFIASPKIIVSPGNILGIANYLEYVWRSYPDYYATSGFSLLSDIFLFSLGACFSALYIWLNL